MLEDGQIGLRPAEGKGGEGTKAVRALIDRIDYPQVDLRAYLKTLIEAGGEMGEVEGQGGNAAFLKVEKNALAAWFIPRLHEAARELIAAHDGHLFVRGPDSIVPVSIDAIRSVLPEVQRRRCAFEDVFQSLSMLYHREAAQLSADMARGEASPADLAAWERYRRVLRLYQDHAQERGALLFTPENHLMAGIRTALYFMLLFLAAIIDRYQAQFEREIAADELGAIARNSDILLMNLARCHLDQLLAIEAILGKHGAKYDLAFYTAEFRSIVARTFILVQGGGGLELQFRPEMFDGIVLEPTERPRTGCPALYASPRNGRHVIPDLAELAFRQFSLMWF